MGIPAGLDQLLAALRHRGIPVGIGEVARLRAAFAAAPRLEREALRKLLGCLLIKRPEQQALFDPLFDAWCPDSEASWEEREEAAQADGRSSRKGSQNQREKPEPASTSRPTGAERLRRPHILAAGAALATLLVLAWVLWQHPKTAVTEPSPEQPARLVPKDRPGSRELAADPSSVARYWRIIDIEVLPPSRLHPAVPALLSLFAALLGLTLWLRWRRRSRIEVAPRTARPGPQWLPLPPEGGSDTRLLAPRERRDLVWNLSHFTAEDLTRRLDEPASVAATVKAGGFAQVRWRHARFPRQVWLWLDEHTLDPALGALADEVCDGLRRNGLACRRGGFAGTPHRVWWSRDDHFQPTRLEGHRNHALVALLSDGEGLRRGLASAPRRPPLETLLRQLRLWPHLVLVDFGDGQRLARLLRPYGLKVIAPSRLAAWLGAQTPGPATAPSEPLLGGLGLWAAACCLAPSPPDAGTALRLARRLGLESDPWRLRALYRDSGTDALRWPSPRRRQLINRLLRSSPRTLNGAPAEDSPARRAIDWWRERCRRVGEREGAGKSPLWPWQGTPAEGRLALERHLLTLYLDPRAAVAGLLSLEVSDPRLGDEIRARLGELRAADQAGDAAGDAQDRDREAIRLGWRLADLPPETQDALVRLGFGGPVLATRRRGIAPTPRLALGLGLAGGVAVALAGAALKLWLAPVETTLVHTPAVLDHPAMAAQTLNLQAPGRRVLGHPLEPLSVAAPEGSQVRAHWQWHPPAAASGEERSAGAEPNNPVRLGGRDDALVFRAGTLAQPIRPCIPGWPARSLALVQGDPQGRAARRLAIRLLDSGTADRVLVTRDWPARLGEFTGSDPLLNGDTRLLAVISGPDGEQDGGGEADLSRFRSVAVVRAGDFEALARWLAVPRRPDPSYRPHPPLGEAPVEVLRQRGDMPWHRGPDQTYDPRTGITWVQVCPGSFTMGSGQADIARPRGDPLKAYSEEAPAHAVVLSGFEVARTETTNAQYRRWPGEGVMAPPRDHAPGKPGNLSVVNVSWQQARDYCRWAGGNLPTEAQWEYAARGGSATAWSFGNDPERLGDYAWYGEGWKNNVHPVAEKDPNPLGLHDMHGNAWEWVRDWYGEYGQDPIAVDPSGPSSGDRRVQRGGCFWYPPAVVRSARRDRNHPEIGDWRVGFRCVRAPARQH